MRGGIILRCILLHWPATWAPLLLLLMRLLGLLPLSVLLLCCLQLSAMPPASRSCC
jgi:hypothetical protein